MSETPDDQRGTFPTSRRRFLGAAALTGAVATVGAFSARSQDGTQTDEIHPVYGFTAASGDVPPPVEPDHEVTLDIRPVEGREEPEFVYDPVGLAVAPGDVVRFTNTLGAHTVTAYHPELERTQRVPDGVPPFSSPLLATGAYWLYRFDQPGVHDMHCIPHEEFGMVARVVVGEPTGTETAAGTGTETAAGTGTETTATTETASGTSTAMATTGAGARQETATETATPTGTSEPGTGTATPAGTPTEEPGDGIDLPQFPPTEAAQRVFDDPAMAPENIVEQGEVAWADLSDETRGIPAQGQAFSVDLSGENQVPPVETDSSGNGMLRLDGTTLEFQLFLSDIQDVTQSHIHEGGADENGSILYTLAQYTENADGSGGGQPRSVIGDNVLVIEGTVEDVDPTLFETPEDLYVNVHTVENPGGEIRGQLQVAEGTPTPTETPSGTETGTPTGSQTATRTGTGSQYAGESPSETS